jgi:predicted SAM-dependent methyltransferase
MIGRFLKSRTSTGLRRAVQDLGMELGVHRRHRTGVKRAKLIAGATSLRLNLGSGFRPKAGWINVDLGHRSDLTLDLRRPLPFDDNSAASIYTEHFLEHLSYPSLDDPTAWELETPHSRSEALTFLRECLRVLIPGGLLDIVVPDAECIVHEYARRRDQAFPHLDWWGPTWRDMPLHCVTYVFPQGREHKYAYDDETLARVLTQTGFTHVERRAFDPEIDAPNHEIGSLCMQARTTRSRAGSGSGAEEQAAMWAQ